MTTPIETPPPEEIPEAAVEAAFRSWNGLHVGTAKDRLYDALAAALPYLAPAASRERAAQRMWELHAQKQSWEELSDLGKDQMHSEADEVLRFAGIRSAPAGDGGLREALAELAKERDSVNGATPSDYVIAPYELRDLLAAHPAAPAEEVK